MSFQNAKDTFYVTLRDRLVALNADRTVVVRGGTRPGVVVEENEMADARAASVSDAFVLRWTGFTVDTSETVALERARCEVHYATAGLTELAGVDRGRALQAMDEELLAMLQPASAVLTRFDGVNAPVVGTTRVFWSDADFSDVAAKDDRLERVATVEVFAWKGGPVSAGVLIATSPVVRGVRMLVAPIDRVSGTPVAFDPAVQGRFENVPAGWFDLGTVKDVEREAETVFTEVRSDAPAMVKTRSRSKVSAGLRCTFSGWSRLAVALSGGSQVMNLLRSGPGGAVEPATPLLPGSTATVLQLPPGSAVAVGDIVVVDGDYTGQTGYVGAAIAGSYVASAGSVGSSPDYIRRVSFNVARVLRVAPAGSGLSVTLASPLIAGVPTSAMKLAVVQGFADRGGGGFVQEWSALLVWEGVQGDRVLVHYPRLQVASGDVEAARDLAPGLQRMRLRAHFHALPVIDPGNGDAVLCYRSYLPAPGRLV